VHANEILELQRELLRPIRESAVLSARHLADVSNIGERLARKRLDGEERLGFVEVLLLLRESLALDPAAVDGVLVKALAMLDREPRPRALHDRTTDLSAQGLALGADAGAALAVIADVAKDGEVTSEEEPRALAALHAVDRRIHSLWTAIVSLARRGPQRSLAGIR
jgi:hypothetical protein